MSSRISSGSSHPTSIAFTTRLQHAAASGSPGVYCFARARRLIVSGISIVLRGDLGPGLLVGGSMGRDDLCAVRRLLEPALDLHAAGRRADLHGRLEETVGGAAICSRLASVRIEL